MRRFEGRDGAGGRDATPADRCKSGQKHSRRADDRARAAAQIALDDPARGALIRPAHRFQLPRVFPPGKYFPKTG